MESPGTRWRDVLVIMLVLGSVWGLVEIGLGGAMKSASIPYKGDLLTGLGIGTMAVAVALTRRALPLIGIAVVAVALKQLAVPILHLAFMCKANSCLAVALAGGSLAGTTAVAGRRLERKLLPRILTGFSAGLISSVAFYWVGMRLAPCKYLLSFNRPGGFVAFLGAEGLIWAALSGIFFPAGYRLGLGMKSNVYALRTRRPVLYYAASAAIITVAWVAGGLAIAAGL
ncbi:MAG TPA: hypothetical protein VMU02_01390 [bacterium]|nr:hypothetical protein [bacterium]